MSQLELLGEKLSHEDVNQKLLKSLSLEWNTYVVVWRSKVNLKTMSMDDLCNNLKVYDQSIYTGQAINTANEVYTTSTQVNAAFSTNIKNLSDVVICAFLASQSNSPQLAHEDLEQIHPYDMEEMDLRWQVDMLIMRVRRFLKKTGRKLTVNGNETLDFDMSKVAEEGPNYAPMPYTSSSSDSKIVDNCKKGLGYKNYNVVPPPYTGNFMPLKPDLNFTGLDEFANMPVDENTKSSEEETKAVRKNVDAPIIEEWVLNN
nr:hypothetical protein [Tanacetum cinerariifolium]